MRHRIVSVTGLGNPNPVILNNKGLIHKEFANDAIVNYFKEYNGFDFQTNEKYITIGIEPAYQYEKLKLISINKNKEESFIKTGKSWGPYGSDIVSNVKIYKNYKNKSKFVRFVDKWHPILFGN